jgi:hypothetical protein
MYVASHIQKYGDIRETTLKITYSWLRVMLELDEEDLVTSPISPI